MQMLETIIALYLLYTMTKIYISFMQAGYVIKQRSEKAVLLSPSNYVKAANYAVAKEKLEIASTFADAVMFCFWVLGGFAFLQSFIAFESQLLNATLFMIGFLALGYVVGLPFEVYKTFKLDAKFGFNNTTPKLFIVDQVKSVGLFLLVCAVVALCVCVFVFSNGAYKRRVSHAYSANV
jgi:STE24 endopeptidase